MVHVEIGLNSEQVSLMRSVYIEKNERSNLVTETSGLYSEDGLNFEWSLYCSVLLYSLMNSNSRLLRLKTFLLILTEIYLNWIIHQIRL